jgi:hypothetical protein
VKGRTKVSTNRFHARASEASLYEPYILTICYSLLINRRAGPLDYVL